LLALLGFLHLASRFSTGTLGQCEPPPLLGLALCMLAGGLLLALLGLARHHLPRLGRVVALDGDAPVWPGLN
jgi:hypothetical protein